ncbi:MAG TPA: NAD(P)H-dependent glycerol-3-phosphate dehydrogenase [Polyangia bacterium]
MRIALLGGGSWGTVLATLAAEAGHDVSLFVRSAGHAAKIAQARENKRYLPGRKLHPGLVVTGFLDQAVVGVDMAVIAQPSGSVRESAAALRDLVNPGAAIVCASKGLEETTGETLNEVLAEALPYHPVALLSGPTFAIEIARGLPGAAVAASTDPACAALVQTVFSSEVFRVFSTDDVVGVAIGGALKNVIAIAAGCSDGLGFGNNARAALITRGLHEMGRLAARLGGNPLTLAGLAGLGDLVLTCTGELSRNRRVGLALAAGEPLPEIMEKLGQVAEGVDTARIAAARAQSLGVDMPITSLVAAVLAGTYTARQAVAELLARSPGSERG